MCGRCHANFISKECCMINMHRLDIHDGLYGSVTGLDFSFAQVKPSPLESPTMRSTGDPYF